MRIIEVKQNPGYAREQRRVYESVQDQQSAYENELSFSDKSMRDWTDVHSNVAFTTGYL